jgi:hypothetical protein
MISEMIAYCGLDCKECKAFKATQAKDSERKKQIARHWMEELKVKFETEDVDCDGCKSKMISGWCRKICKIRPCAREKKVKSCAHCDNYPCNMLKEFLSKEEPIAAKNLDKIRKTFQF